MGNFRISLAAVMTAALSLCFSVSLLIGGELRVPGEYETIQAAVNASFEGDEIVISPGRYTGEGNCDIDFEGKLITVRSEMPDDWNTVESTIIDCGGSEDNPHRGFIFRNHEDPNAMVSGLTIINGSAFEGGAILCQEGSPTIQNCIFKHNKALNSNGGAIACFYTDNVLIKNCVFTQNQSSHTGGAICSNDNKRLKIVNCLIANNNADSKGGGLYCRDNRSISVINCTIVGNRAGFAGGIYGIGDLGSSANIVNTIIWDNQFPGLGGAHAWNDLKVNYCVLQEIWDGLGNRDQDPELDSDGRISSSSSVCVDKGGFTRLAGKIDIDNEPRVSGSQIDIGCDEWQP